MILDEDIASGCPKAITDFVRNNPDIEVYEYIQRGLNGEVYFGKRKKLNDEVVIKFYHALPHYDASEEVAILRNIEHPNVLKIWHVGFVPPTYFYFLTPKISGGDLQGYLDNNAISSKDALKMVAGILSGLTELHSIHHLVHRDLKPGNILLDLNTKTPIIADLGTVRKIVDENNPVSASKATRVYLPPESIKDDEFYLQSDIYQVGLIMFQLLNGFFPINDPTKWLNTNEFGKINSIRNSIERDNKFYEIIDNKICKGRLADIHTLPEHLDKDFKKVLNKALNIDYTQRFPSASQFLKSIHKLINLHPSYLVTPDCLLVEHSSGKKYKIYQEKGHNYILEKQLNGKNWRKEHHHNGTFQSVIQKARKG